MPARGLDGLKEYHGRPGRGRRFHRRAPRSWSTHLAPVTGGMLDRLPSLKLIAVSRGGPVNIDMRAARDARRAASSTRPAATPRAVAEFTIGAILAETRLIRAGHEALRQGEWRGDLYRADLTGARARAR